MVNSKHTKIQNRREINLLSPKARTITDVEAGSKVLYTWMPESSSPYIVKNLLIDFDNGCGNDDEEKKERIFRQNLPSGWGLVWVGICIIFEIRAKIRVQTFRAAMSFNKRSLIQPGHCIQHWGHHWRKRWRGREDEGTSFLLYKEYYPMNSHCLWGRALPIIGIIIMYQPKSHPSICQKKQQQRSSQPYPEQQPNQRIAAVRHIATQL